MIVCFTKQNDNVCYGTLLLLNKIHVVQLIPTFDFVVSPGV